MKKIIDFNVLSKAIIFALAFSCFGCAFMKPPENNAEWEPLFNGTDLDNWQVKIRGHELNDNFGNTFRVREGNMQIRYDQYENGFDNKFGHIFYEEAFSSYLLGVEYRFIGNQIEEGPGDWAYRNNGIMIHGQDPATMEINQDFPNSIEVQLLGGNGTDERPTANICTPGTQFVMDGKIIKTHCTLSTSPTFHGDQWVRVEVLVLQDSLIAHYVNGEEVMRYEKPQADPVRGNGEGESIRKGSISLQSESHPTDFRKVEIVNLEKYENDPEKLGQIVEKLMSEKRIAKQD